VFKKKAENDFLIRYGSRQNPVRYAKNSGKATILKFNKEEDGSDGENEQILNTSSSNFDFK